MKKIFAALALCLTFAISASAQTDTKSVDAAAKKDAAALSEAVGLTSDQVKVYEGLFKTKHLTLADANTSEAKKEELATAIQYKLEAGLQPEQMDKLRKNPELLKKLTH